MIGIKMLSIKTINYSHRQYRQMYSFYLIYFWLCWVFVATWAFLWLQ